MAARPETGAANALDCIVMERLFHGDRLRIELAPEGGGKPLFAELARTALPATVSAGSRLAMHIDPDDVMVFDAGGGK